MYFCVHIGTEGGWRRTLSDRLFRLVAWRIVAFGLLMHSGVDVRGLQVERPCCASCHTRSTCFFVERGNFSADPDMSKQMSLHGVKIEFMGRGYRVVVEFCVGFARRSCGVLSCCCYCCAFRARCFFLFTAGTAVLHRWRCRNGWTAYYSVSCPGLFFFAREGARLGVVRCFIYMIMTLVGNGDEPKTNMCTAEESMSCPH